VHSLSRLVIASGNAGKLREFRRLLAPLGIDVIAQAELGIEETDEPHSTSSNALAQPAAQHTRETPRARRRFRRLRSRARRRARRA
jgi:XTP/dITP diphosphohydrolase